MKRDLRVGVDHAPPAPLCFGLPNTSDFRGFEVDLLDGLAARLEARLCFTSALWSQILAELRAGRIDLICTAATITEERRRTVDFSDPYLETALMLVTRIDETPGVQTRLNRARIGVRAATVAEGYVRNHYPAASVLTFDLNVRQYEALRDRMVDVVVDDEAIAGYFAGAVAGLCMGPRLPGTDCQYGIVVARGNEGLRKALNEALAAMRQDGGLEQLRQRWLA